MRRFNPVLFLIMVVMFGLFASLLFGGVAVQADFATKVYKTDGGDVMNVTPGGEIQYNGAAMNVTKGSATVTGTASIDVGLVTPSAVFLQLQNPSASSGAPAIAYATIGGVTANITVKQDDFSTNASSAADIYWTAIGQ